jgi:biotin-[acetyl-CoA-carboxylase] ligase BirA-like protein
MAVYTDSPDFASALLPGDTVKELSAATVTDPEVRAVLDKMADPPRTLLSASSSSLPWPYLFLSSYSSGSQYDRLIELARDGIAPHGTICLAGAGSGFHGFKGRSWEALPGNLHVSIHLSPRVPVDRFQVAFTVLAAVSVVDALDRVEGLRGKAGIKWVNDVLLGEGKVAGVLAYTQSQGERVSSAVLGIGLNVETAPPVEPTPFVPLVTSVRRHAPHGNPDLRREIFLDLLSALRANYENLLAEGFSPLLRRYRDRSVVMGRLVTVCSERSDQTMEVLAQGRVTGLGENLELVLEGRPDPVTGGRLAMGRSTAYTWQLAPGAPGRRGPPGASEDDV